MTFPCESVQWKIAEFIKQTKLYMTSMVWMVYNKLVLLLASQSYNPLVLWSSIKLASHIPLNDGHKTQVSQFPVK